MIETNVLTLQAKIMNTGSVFIWGTRPNQGVWDVSDLRFLLFAWHKPSFFGTFIEEKEWHHIEGVELKPAEALDFFCEPRMIQHLNIRFSPALQDMIQLAPAIRESLLAGKVMPDYFAWKKGSLVWKIQLPEDVLHLESSTNRDWVQALVITWIESTPFLQEQIQQMQASLSSLKPISDSSLALQDEEDWLVSIGWHQESRPTRTCLQLIEPHDESAWQLRIVIQDRIHSDEQRIVTEQGTLVDCEPWPMHWPEHWITSSSHPAEHIKRDIQKWNRIVPSLFTSAEENRFSLRTALNEQEAWHFLTEDSLKLMEAGYVILYPAWWIKLRKTKPKLRAKVKSSVGSHQVPLFGLQQLVDFDWRLAIGDIELTEEEFRQLLAQKQKLIQIRGNWLQLDARVVSQIEHMLKKVHRKKGLSFRDVLELHFAQDPVNREDQLILESDEMDYSQFELEVELNDHIQQVLNQLNQDSTIPILTTPSSFHGTLRHYQTEGASWLVYLRQFGLGGLLADDMGLGKTIQWISYLLHIKEHEHTHSPSLLICPTSVLGNWQMELKRFAPSLRVHLHYGTQRVKADAFYQKVREFDLVITSYTLSHIDAKELTSVTWNSICLDEAQHIKNTYTKQSTTIRKLQGNHRIALTGTPIENRLTELWSIFEFINPGYLGSQKEFSSRYVQAIEKQRNPQQINRIQKLIRPFLLRRMKKDPVIQLDLPEKNEANVYISLTIEQSILYENYIQEMFRQIDELNQMERRGLILKTLTRLKQLCNHPSLVLKEGLQTKWHERSNKLERLLEMVQELRDQGDKCLIFTQFVETGHLIQHVISDKLGEQAMFLHGGTTKVMRDEMITRFQKSDEPSKLESPSQQPDAIFILSLKAGGVGLNLTAANHVFHFDRWWNPAVEKQATDRAYRWGQTRHVQVHKFVTLGTLEERINDMLERKQGLSEQIVGNNESWITEMSTEELKEVFRLRREWI